MPGPFMTLPVGGDVRPPFEVAGPNGREYFDILRPVQRVPQTIEWMVISESEVATIIRRSNDPKVKEEMLTLLKELRKTRQYMETQLTTIAVETAAYGDKKIKDNIRRTNVRPDRTKRLENSIVCEPIPTSIPTAAVGIAALQALKRGTRVPSMPDGYWASMEFGFTLTSRIVPGYFMPGYSRPEAAQFRNHPTFSQFPYAKGVPAMNIVNPIDFPPRNFLRGSLDDIWLYRHQRVTKLRQVVATALNGVSKGATAASAIAAGTRNFGRP